MDTSGPDPGRAGGDGGIGAAAHPKACMAGVFHLLVFLTIGERALTVRLLARGGDARRWNEQPLGAIG